LLLLQMRAGPWLALLALGIGVLSGAVQAAPSWKVEDASELRFVARQQGAPVEGAFENFSATIDFDPNDLASSRIEVDIDVTTITTGHKDRDATLRSPAFFDVEQWPRARFVSQRIAAAGDGQYQAEGQLTIRGVTKDVTLPFALEISPAAGGQEAKAEGELQIKRLDYGVGQGDWATTTMVADEVVIKLSIVATTTG
jgi:polyisoprenoid-binding protein YceI